MSGNRAVCRATRRDGEPCRATLVGASGYCLVHDPALEGQRAEWRRTGGRNKSTVARTGGRNKSTVARATKVLQGDKEMGDVLKMLKSALEETYKGTLEARSAKALASLSNAVVRMHETGVLELRIKALEGREDTP